MVSLLLFLLLLLLLLLFAFKNVKETKTFLACRPNKNRPWAAFSL